MKNLANTIRLLLAMFSEPLSLAKEVEQHVYHSITYFPDRDSFSIYISAYFASYFTKYEKCAESWWRTLCCYLAHGNDVCGSKSYAETKIKWKGVYEKIRQQLSSKDLVAYCEEQSDKPSCLFRINRKWVSLEFKAIYHDIPDAILSEEFAKQKEAFQRDPNDGNSRFFLKLAIAKEMGIPEYDVRFSE